MASKEMDNLQISAALKYNNIYLYILHFSNLKLHPCGRGPGGAVPAAVLGVALSHCLLQLPVEEGQLLPALLLLRLVKDGRVEVVHGVSGLQQEVVPHRLQVAQQPEGEAELLRSPARRHTERAGPHSPVVLLQSPHEVPAALDVAPLDVRVEAAAQRELEGLDRHGLRGAVHGQSAAREHLQEVLLLQVQPEGRRRRRA